MRSTILFLAVAALLVGATAVVGKPPGGGGGGGGTAATGTIWYWSINATARSIEASGANDQPATGGHPSHDLHGGKRWFLRSMGGSGITLPDGNQAGRVAAWSDAGDQVELVGAAAGRQVGSYSTFSFRWSKDDAYASYLVTEWWGSGTHDADTYIRRIAVDWTGGAPVAVGSEETVLEAPVSHSLGNAAQSQIFMFDWAPPGEGDKVVYWLQPDSGGATVRVYDVTADSETVLGAGRQPEWAPSGSKITFSFGDVFTINPDGSGKTRVHKGGDNSMWSPDSAFVVLRHAGRLKYVGASGGKATTVGTAEPWFPFGWR
jgi:hypothetical protein